MIFAVFRAKFAILQQKKESQTVCAPSADIWASP